MVRYYTVLPNGGYFIVSDNHKRELIVAAGLGRLVDKIKREQSEGRLKDAPILTGEPVERGSVEKGLNLEQHALFWKLYSAKS